MKSLFLSIQMAALATTALAATVGEFSVLTMNVAGLPAILQGNDVPGDKVTNSKLIGSYFKEFDYDIIHVQEDFNYHAYIYAADDHPYRTATSGGVPFGSGLNTLAKFPFIDDTRVKWNTCSDASSNDCLTPKGFTFMRVQVDDGVYIDCYNLHTDAGTEAGDEVARTANVKQVADYINIWSAGNAVMVFGDTNSRYTRTLDNINLFSTQNGLTDAFVQLERNDVIPAVETICANSSLINTCETVDKVFYRGSPILDLEAYYFNYESSKFVQSDGSILSDHNPISVNLTWSLSSTLRQSNFIGGPHGTWYTDVSTVSKISKPKTSIISFSGSSRIDSVGLTLTSGAVFRHGGSGGTPTSLTLAADEYWTSAVVCQGQKSGNTRIFSILATTSKARTLSSGETTSDCSTFTAPAGWQIVGYLGRDGDEIDRLAFVYAPQ